MSEPEIAVNKLAHYAFVPGEILDGGAELEAMVHAAPKQATDPSYVAPKPWEGEPLTPPPAGYGRLIEDAGHLAAGVLVAVVELHGPVPWSVHTDGTVTRWDCQGCDADGYDWEHPTWPCRTSELIAQRLGVELGEMGDG